MCPVELPHLLHWLHELRHRHVRRVFRAVVASGTALAQHALGNASEEQRALDELPSELVPQLVSSALGPVDSSHPDETTARLEARAIRTR